MDNKGRLDNLMLITDTGLFSNSSSFLDAIEKSLAGGVRLIQLREKGLSGRDLLGLAHKVREKTRRYKAKLIINGRADIAKLAEADGLHLPAKALSVRDARELMGADALIGVSTHSAVEALAAEADGADYLTLSPIYETPSKARYGESIGLGPLKKASSTITIPIYALGGIKAERIREVMDGGAYGAALISAILASKDSFESARRINAEIKNYQKNLLSRKE